LVNGSTYWGLSGAFTKTFKICPPNTIYQNRTGITPNPCELILMRPTDGESHVMIKIPNNLYTRVRPRYDTKSVVANISANK